MAFLLGKGYVRAVPMRPGSLGTIGMGRGVCSANNPCVSVQLTTGVIPVLIITTWIGLTWIVRPVLRGVVSAVN